MRKAIHYLLLTMLAGPVLLLDQWTKWLVRNQLTIGESWMPVEAIRPYFAIVRWTNTGAAFGMFQEGGMVFAVLAIIVSAVILYYYRNSDDASWLVRIALGLQLGGALGNLIDRLTQGLTVTDFLWFSFFPAVFNVADAAISVGVVLLMLDVLLERKNSGTPEMTSLPVDETASPANPPTVPS
jgi:signal peptidase II